MVSWGELLVTVTAAGYLLGRKELPKLAHFVGTYSGRSVGAIIRAKKEFFDATKDSDLVKLQREFQRGIDELNEIRSELTSVGSMTRPHQPSGSVDDANQSSPVTPAASAFTASSAHAEQAPLGNAAAVSAAGRTAAAGVRSSISLASEYASLQDTGEKRSESASLAIAEMKLAQQGKYAPRLESVEGGADYVSASIMDSLLLEKQSKKQS